MQCFNIEEEDAEEVAKTEEEVEGVVKFCDSNLNNPFFMKNNMLRWCSFVRVWSATHKDIHI